MEIKIQYTGQLAGIAGTSEETVTIEEGATLKPIVEALAQQHGPEYDDLVFDSSGDLRPSLLVIVDGEQAEGDKTSLDLSSVNTVMLMTPIAGG